MTVFHSTCAQAFTEATPEQLQEVVATNLTGSLLCTRRAMQIMSQQKTRGHIFNMDGAGADGVATPQYAAYGATKAGMQQATFPIIFRMKKNTLDEEKGDPNP